MTSVHAVPEKNIRSVMGKTKAIIIFILIVAAFVTGVYFFIPGAKNFQQIDFGSLVNQVAKEIVSPPPLNIGGTQKNVVLVKDKIIEQTNFQRALNQSEPLEALKENQILDAVALAKANDMFKNQYFDHVSPAGVGPGQLAEQYGYDYIVEGENLILGNFSSEQELVQDWMNSPGHRANILNNRYTEIGVAIVKGVYKGESVWIGVQEFGLPVSSCQQPNAAVKNQIEFNEAQLDEIVLQINQRRQQIESADSRTKVYRQMVEDYNNLVKEYNSLADQTKSLISQYNQQVNIFNACVSGQ